MHITSTNTGVSRLSRLFEYGSPWKLPLRVSSEGPGLNLKSAPKHHTKTFIIQFKHVSFLNFIVLGCCAKHAPCLQPTSALSVMSGTHDDMEAQELPSYKKL